MAATLRQQSVNWCPSTHACVEFFDGKKSAVPLSCISTSESGKSVRVGDEVEVKWTDGKKYTAAVTALGGRKQMDAVLATLSSDEALSDDEKEGEERPKSQSEVDKDGELTDDTVQREPPKHRKGKKKSDARCAGTLPNSVEEDKVEKETTEKHVITENAAQVWMSPLSKHSKDKKKSEAALARSAELLSALKKDKEQVNVAFEGRYGLQNAEDSNMQSWPAVKKRKVSCESVQNQDNDSSYVSCMLSPSTSWSSFGESFASHETNDDLKRAIEEINNRLHNIERNMKELQQQMMNLMKGFTSSAVPPLTTTQSAVPNSKGAVGVSMTAPTEKGCWLGDPNGEQVWIEGADQGKVLASEFISDTPAKLAVHLMTVLFTETQLQTGNCTPTPSGRPLLDQRTINGIRLHVQYKYPEVDPHVWKHIIQVNMNSKCRTLRASAKKSSAASTVKPGV